MPFLNSIKRKYWGQAVLWVALIYATLYPVRPLCEFLKRTTPFALLTNVLLVTLLAGMTAAVVRAAKFKKFSSYFLMLLTVMVYLYGLNSLDFPEEKIHFFEYGVLAYLVFRALRIDFSEGVSYPAAFAVCSLLGWVDEGIQEIPPNRYYQLSDVVLNSVSSALGLFLIYVFRRERLKSF